MLPSKFRSVLYLDVFGWLGAKETVDWVRLVYLAAVAYKKEC